MSPHSNLSFTRLSHHVNNGPDLCLDFEYFKQKLQISHTNTVSQGALGRQSCHGWSLQQSPTTWLWSPGAKNKAKHCPGSGGHFYKRWGGANINSKFCPSGGTDFQLSTDCEHVAPKQTHSVRWFGVRGILERLTLLTWVIGWATTIPRFSGCLLFRHG